MVLMRVVIIGETDQENDKVYSIIKKRHFSIILNVLLIDLLLEKIVHHIH
jgi:hypothetical protein